MTRYTLCLLVVLAMAFCIQGQEQEQIDVMNKKELTVGLLELQKEVKKLRNDFNNFGEGSDSRGPGLTECPRDWVAHGSSCYAVGIRHVTWAEAQEFCEVHGGHLAEIETAEENDFIKDFLWTHTAPLVDYAWLGGTDVFTDGKWVWASTGLPFDYEDFQPGEGAQPGGDCVLAGRPYHFKWMDIHCTASHTFVCETRTEAGHF